MVDNSIDTSSLNQLGIIFYQDPNNGEIDFYWDDNEICSPSLMPENTGIEISGDSTDIEERCFQIMAKELNKQRRMAKNIDNVKDMDIPISIKNKSTDNVDNMDIDIPIPKNMDDTIPKNNTIPKNDTTTKNDTVPKNNTIPKNNENNGNDELDELESMVKDMIDALSSDKNQEKLEKLEEERLSPRDPEREGPALSEEMENTEEGALYRLEHDPVFQDEAGLMYGDDSEGKIWPDDEGMDPMENQ